MIIGVSEIMIILVLIFDLIVALLFMKMAYKLKKIDSIHREPNRVYRELR